MIQNSYLAKPPGCGKTLFIPLPTQNSEEPRKGIVNGLYIAFYYAGGVIGSFFPGYVYRSYGWTFFILTLIAVALCALVLIYSARRQAADLIMAK
jgi:predicted MFS family arabinose efflux permease